MEHPEKNPKNPTPEKQDKTSTPPTKKDKTPAHEPVFTPPSKPGDFPNNPEIPDDVVGDGEEFEVVEVEELPAEPHEHGRSHPFDEGPDSKVIGADNDADKIDTKGP